MLRGSESAEETRQSSPRGQQEGRKRTLTYRTDASVSTSVGESTLGGSSTRADKLFEVLEGLTGGSYRVPHASFCEVLKDVRLLQREWNHVRP